VLWKIFVLKRDEVNEQFRVLSNEELRDLSRSLSVVKIGKCRRSQWTGFVAMLKETRNA